MSLNAPTQLVFIIAVVLAVVALLMYFGVFLASWAFWTMTVAFVLLAGGCLLKGV